MTRILIPVLAALLLLGCSRKQEMERAAAPGADANTSGPLTQQPALPADTAHVAAGADTAHGAMALGVAEAVVRAFAGERLTDDETLYVAYGRDQDPPAHLFVRLRDVPVLPLSRRPSGEAGTVLYLTEQTHSASKAQVQVRWQRGAMGAGGSAIVVQDRGRWTVQSWDWAVAQ